MKALTLAQPVASAITHGRKRIENRTWRPGSPPGWVAIHAGKGWWAARRHDERGQPTRPRPVARGLEITRDLWRGSPRPSFDQLRALPTRAFLGAMRIDKLSPVADVDDDMWAIGPWCWVIGAVVVLDESIPWAVGRLGLWTVPDGPELEALVSLVQQHGGEACSSI